MVIEMAQRHLEVTFTNPRGRGVAAAPKLTLHFRAEEHIAAEFAAAMARYGGVLVRVDDRVSEAMRLLPCAELFQP